MFSPRQLITYGAFFSTALAAPSLARRQSTSCLSSYDCAFEIRVAGCSAEQLVDGQLRVQNSSISEIADGQARCDLTGSAAASFTLSNGEVTDSAGRLCEISSQNQFQCSATPDAGATTTGFSVCNNLLAFNSNSSFIACLATGDLPGYNIYTANVDRSTVTNCMPIELDIPACASASSSCVASTVTSISTVTPAAVTVTATATETATTQVTVPVTVTVTVPVTQVVTTTAIQPTTVTTIASVPAVATTQTSSAPAATCTNINASLGSTSFPRTIIPVNSNSPSTVYGSSYFGYIGNGNSTIFTFDSQASSGACSITFHFPTTAEIQAQSGTTSYSLSSSSIAVTLYELTGVAAITDSYASKPARGTAYSATLTPGQTTTFETLAACPASTVSYELVATDGNTLSFFEGTYHTTIIDVHSLTLSSGIPWREVRSGYMSCSLNECVTNSVDYNPPVLGLTVATCA